VLDKYALLPTGSSMGDGYGPMIVAKRGSGLKLAELPDITIAVPGKMTTAFLALRLLCDEVHAQVVPFDEIGRKVADGDFEAGLIIHEGQLTYQDEGLELLQDLGVWWKEETGLPLPLGGNAIRKELGPERMVEINRILKASIEKGLERRSEALAHAMHYARNMDQGRADEFVGMYVNDFTLDYGDLGRKAVQVLLERGAAAGLLPAVDHLEFVGS
jgi:1,4-dihydroxy-6-naphthoate synthase